MIITLCIKKLYYYYANNNKYHLLYKQDHIHAAKSMSVSGRDPSTEDMLPTWMATENLSSRQAKEEGSPVSDFSLLQSSRRKHMGSVLTVPQVSAAISWNW